MKLLERSLRPATARDTVRRLAGHPVSLALQGGGAHGAFTWGVLDALLEDGELVFDGISGASAGAMNATVLAQGLMQGGRDGAREALQAFWQAVAASVPFDATLGAGGVGPLHLKITHQSWHEARNMTPLFPVIRVLGRVQIDVVNVTY